MRSLLDIHGHSAWQWLMVVLGLWLLVFQATRLYTTPLAYDDAYLAAAAKSLAFGHGYATHYPTRLPFDVRLGVGLALQIPAAGLMALLGNRYWVPGLVTVLAIDSLLLAILFQWRSRLQRPARFQVAVAGLVAAALLTADRDEWILSHWYAFLGDIPASLAVILGILLLSRDLDEANVPRMTSGLLMGVAIEMKLVTVIGVAPAALYGMVVGFRSGRPDARQRLLLFASATLVPTVLVQFWELWALGGLTGYLDHIGTWRAYLASDASGAGLSGLQTVDVILARALVNARAALEYFTSASATVAVVILGLLIAVRFWNRSANSRPMPGEQRVAGSLLWAAFAAHAGWWLFFSTTGWINHLLPALLYLSAAFSLALTVPAKPLLVIATWIVVGIVSFPRVVLISEYVPSFSRDPKVQSALEVRGLLISQKADGLIHLACGWWVPRDLEYLLPGTGNFRDCFQVPPSTFATHQVVLVRNLEFWNWEKNARMQVFADSCERTTAFRNAHYVLSRCASPP